MYCIIGVLSVFAVTNFILLLLRKPLKSYLNFNIIALLIIGLGFVVYFVIKHFNRPDIDDRNMLEKCREKAMEHWKSMGYDARSIKSYIVPENIMPIGKEGEQKTIVYFFECIELWSGNRVFFCMNAKKHNHFRIMININKEERERIIESLAENKLEHAKYTTETITEDGRVIKRTQDVPVFNTVKIDDSQGNLIPKESESK